MTTFTKSALSLALCMAFTGYSVAGVGDITVNGSTVTVDDPKNSFTLGTDGDVVSVVGKNTLVASDTKQALSLFGANKEVVVKGQTITLKSTKRSTVESQKGASIKIGNEKTANVNVTVDYTGTGSGGVFGALIVKNDQAATGDGDKPSTHLSVDGNNIDVKAHFSKTETRKGNSLVAAFVSQGSSLLLTGHGPNSKVSISATGNHDVRAIHVASNTLTPVGQSSLTIDADRVVINATHTNGGQAHAIVAMSKGIVSINGDTTITADNVILARGQADVAINTDGKHFTQLNGNIDFNYDKDTSGSTVDASVKVTLTGANSYWNGNVVTSYGSGKPPEENQNVKGFVLTMTDGAQWTPTAIPTEEGQTTGQKAIPVNNLVLNDGIVNVNTGVDVQVENLKGKGGTVRLATDLAATEGKQTGSLDIIQSESGSSLGVQLMDKANKVALTSDEVNAEEAKKLLGNVTGKDVAVSTQVAEGMYNPAFGVDAKGQTQTASVNTLMQSSLELASAAPLALNRILMSDVRKRLGDIRTTEGTSGAWARYDGGRLSGANGLENDFHTIQVGVDTQPTADPVRFGVALSYTTSDSDYARGSADMDAYSLAGYGLWLGEKGQYFDVVTRLASAKTDMTVDGNKKGSMDNIALSLSGEFGWRFDVAKAFYVEPQVEATYTYVDADQLTLSNGATYQFDSVDSFLGRLGVAFGMKCPNNKGNVYARVSAVHEFLGDMAVTGANGAAYKLDGKDTWVEYGIGANFNVTPNTYLYTELERCEGAALEEDWRANLGVRIAF